MCGSKGSAPTPSGASTTTGGTSAGQSVTNFGQGPTPATAARYENFLNQVDTLSNTPFNPAMLSNVSPLNAYQDASLNQMFNVGMNLGNFDPNQVQQIMSPYIGNVVGATQGWFNNQNAIQSNDLLGQAIRSGNAFGGDRAGVAQSVMAGQQQLAQAPVIAGLYQSGYSQALDEYNKLKQFSVQGAEEAMKAGTVRQAQSQRELDVATANAQQQSAYPFQVANWEGAALGGIGALTGTVGQGTTSTTANSTGVSTPPTPNPLTQVLGIGSAIGGLFTSKDGGRVPERFASGGYLDDDSGYDDQERNREDDTKIETTGTKDEVLRDIEKVGEQQPVQAAPPDIMGKFRIPRYKQPYIRIPNLAATGGPNMQQAGSPTAAPSQAGGGSAGSSIGGTLGGIAGTAIGGPIGGAIGGAAGRLFGGLFHDGGTVPPGPIRYLALGGPSDDEETLGDTGDEGDPAVPPMRMASLSLAPRTGNAEDEAAFKRNMAGARPMPLAVSTQTVRPSIPSPDPLAPYLGTEGPRSLTGPPRGSPAGYGERPGNPVQAREVSPLQLTRERVGRELEDNPRLARTFDANTTAEVGRGAGARQGYQAATIDRAIKEGRPLGAIVNNPNYYPSRTTRSTATSGQGVDESIWAGANPVNYATGNASYDPKTGRHVGFAGGPQTASIGAERYGIEGQSGLPYARAVGYTGPDRTAIGFGPGAPTGSQGTQLAGGPNTSGDLEISAQARRGPQGDPNAPNFGYGPVTTQNIPELGRPQRSFGQRWAVNPLTQAGIAMLRSQSPYFATGLGEGLAGAAGAIEHTREEEVLDSKPKLLTDFPTFRYQKGDGTFVDTHIPNPSYDARKVPRDRLDFEKSKAAQESKQDWKETGMFKDGVPVLFNKRTGQYKLAEQVDQTGKVIPPATPAPTTQQPATTTEPPAQSPAAWVPNLAPDPNDPAIKELIPPEATQTKKQMDDRAKANIKTLDKAREQHEAANQQIGRMNQMETALNALPKTGFMSPGYLAGYNSTIAQAINHAARMVGANEFFSDNDVANMQEANKIKTLGGFLQSRLTGGGQHNAASIISASMRAYPGAENSPQGAALIIAANREVSQRDRDYYEFITKHGNTTFRGDINAATLAFDRLAPMEKYIERARAKVEARFGPNPAAPTTQQPNAQQQTGPQPAIGARRQFKQGWGVWDGQQWQPERQ